MLSPHFCDLLAKFVTKFSSQLHSHMPILTQSIDEECHILLNGIHHHGRQYHELCIVCLAHGGVQNMADEVGI